MTSRKGCADRRRVARPGERDAAEGIAAAACCGITSSTQRARRRGDPRGCTNWRRGYCARLTAAGSTTSRTGLLLLMHRGDPVPGCLAGPTTAGPGRGQSVERPARLAAGEDDDRKRRSSKMQGLSSALPRGGDEAGETSVGLGEEIPLCKEQRGGAGDRSRGSRPRLGRGSRLGGDHEQGAAKAEADGLGEPCVSSVLAPLLLEGRASMEEGAPAHLLELGRWKGAPRKPEPRGRGGAMEAMLLRAGENGSLLPTPWRMGTW